MLVATAAVYMLTFLYAHYLFMVRVSLSSNIWWLGLWTAHVLVFDVGKGSHELWHLDDFDASILVDIGVSPGLKNFPLTLALFALTKAMIFFYLSRVLSTSIVHVRVEVLLVQHENAAYLALFFGYGFRCGTMARVSESNQMLSVGIIAVRAFWMFLMAAVLATGE